MRTVLGRKGKKAYKSQIRAGGSAGTGHSGIELADAGEREDDHLMQMSDSDLSDEVPDVDAMPDDGPQPRQNFLVRYFMPLVDERYEDHPDDVEFHESGEREMWFLVTLVMIVVVVLVLGALYWDFFG